MKLDEKLAAELAKVPPELQAMAKDYARLAAQVKAFRHALRECERNHAHLFTFMLAILRQMPGHEMRFSETDFEQYEKFRDAWQMESAYVEETREQVIFLKEKGAKP